MRVVRENSPLKCVLIPMGDSLCAKLLLFNSVGYSYSLGGNMTSFWPDWLVKKVAYSRNNTRA